MKVKCPLLNSPRLGRMIDVLFRYLRALTILVACLWAGTYVSGWLPIVVPGSIVGLLLLFFLLALGLIPPDWVQCGCTLFMRYMTLLFIPSAMGIMKYYPLLLANFMSIVVSCLASSVIVLILVGKLTQLLQTRSEKGAD